MYLRAGEWLALYRRSKRGTFEERQAAAVARILRATVVALGTNNLDELDELANKARALLGRRWGRGGIDSAHAEELARRWTLPDGSLLQFGDPINEKGQPLGPALALGPLLNRWEDLIGVWQRKPLDERQREAEALAMGLAGHLRISSELKKLDGVDDDAAEEKARTAILRALRRSLASDSEAKSLEHTLYADAMKAVGKDREQALDDARKAPRLFKLGDKGEHFVGAIRRKPA